MGTTYTSTIQVAVWKEHCCVACGTAFRYLLRRKKKGQGDTPQAARTAAQKAVSDALAQEVDMHPCTRCGLYQPDMIAERRSHRHGVLLILGAGVCAVIAFLMWMDFGHSDALPPSRISWIAACAAGVLALAHLCVDLPNPNSHCAANLARARRDEEAGVLWTPDEVGREPVPASDSLGRGVTRLQWWGHGIQAAAAVVLFAPWAVLALAGMKDNSTWRPEVVGPGESATVYLPYKIQSVKGLWRGDASVVVAKGGERAAVLTAASSTENWGGTISVKQSEKNSSARLWVRVTLPNDPALAGKTLNLKIVLNVAYPTLQGDKAFVEREQQFTHQAELNVSGAGTGTVWRFVLWGSSTLGLVLLLGGGTLTWTQANIFAEQALATKIHVPDLPNVEPEEEQPPPNWREITEDDKQH